MNILIIDDSDRKIDKLSALIREGVSAEKLLLRVARSQADGKGELLRYTFDLVILDIQLPLRQGEMPVLDGGLSLLREVHTRECYRKPTCIIGLTAFAESLAVSDESFGENLWSLVLYEENSDSWAERLRHKISYLVSVEDCKRRQPSAYTLGVITALNRPEFEALRSLGEWEVIDGVADDTRYFRGRFQGHSKEVSVVAACAADMGMAATAVLATKMISHFAPRYLGMIGIMAGVSGAVELGDIVVADPTWDWGSGKRRITDDRVTFEPDPKQHRLDPHLMALFQDVQLDHELLKAVWTGWNGVKSSRPPTCHIGPCASGSCVLADGVTIQSIRDHSRKLLGIDMEAYGLMCAANDAAEPRPYGFSVKCVCDYANGKKDDSLQAYAAYTSAAFLKMIALKYWSQGGVGQP